MKTPLVYIVDSDLVSAFEIKIKIHQSKMHCKVISFEYTDTAFEMLSSDYLHKDGLPDIMLVSFDMPGMDGPSFLKELENNGLITESTTLYIFSTFNISAEQQKYIDNKRVKGFFTKPLSDKDIQKIFTDLQNNPTGREISL